MINWPKRKGDELVALDRGAEETKCLHVKYTSDLPEVRLSITLPTKELTGEWIAKNGLSGMPVASPFVTASMQIQELEFPPMPSEDLEEAMRWHLTGLVEDSVEDYMIRYSGTPDEKGESRRFIVYAVRKTEIFAIMDELRRLRLEPVRLEPAVVSLAGAADFIEGLVPGETIILLDIGKTKTLLAVVCKGELMQGRVLNPLDSSSEPYYQWAVSIQNAIDAYSVRFKDRPIKKIYLAGGGAAGRPVSEYLSQNLGIAASQLSFNIRLAGDSPYLFAGALGVARKGLET